MSWITLVAVTLAGLFAGLAALHLYWAAVGGGNLAAAVPQKGGEPLFRPGPGACLAVALALALAALLCLAQGGMVPWIPPFLARAGVWGLVVVFTVRAVGDFRYVGFFKRVRDSRFAYLDTRFYSPLCVLLAGLALWLVVSKP
jgi:hypothetical protein